MTKYSNCGCEYCIDGWDDRCVTCGTITDGEQYNEEELRQNCGINLISINPNNVYTARDFFKKTKK